MANRYPLIVDTTDGNKIKELPSGDNLQLTGNNIIGVTNVTASGTVAASALNATSIKKGGTEISTVALTGSYTDLTNRPTSLSEFTDDLNVLVPGDNIGLLTNNVGYLTTVSFSQLTNKPSTIAGYGIIDALQTGSNITSLVNNAGYITVADVQNGLVTIDVNNTGDLVGSVFADDSTIMIDSILAAVNLDGTIRGNVKPAVGTLYDLGGAGEQFKDAYFSGTVNTNSAVFDSNVYGGTGNRLWLGGNDSEGTPSVNIPNEAVGVTLPIIVSNQMGGGVAISTEGGDWIYGADGSLEFPGSVTHSIDTTTGGTSTSSPTTLDIAKTVLVLNSADTNDDSWLLPDGVEGQVVHLVPGTGAATNQHYVQITNWRKWDEGAGVAGEWRVVTGHDWTPFVFENTTPVYRSLATAVFVNGAWHTDTPWID